MFDRLLEIHSGSLVQAILAALVHAGAGVPYLIYSLNRRLSLLRSGMDKLVTLFVFALLWLALPAAAGWVLASRPGLPSLLRWAFPLFTAVLWLWGDIRLAVQKHRLRGCPPVDVYPPQAHGWEFLRRPNTTLDLTRVSYEIPWDGPTLTVAQITDLHLNAHIPLDFYRQAIDLVNQAHPDLIFLSGDFVTYRHNLPLLPDLLRPLRTSGRVRAENLPPHQAVVASLGNHDYWADGQTVSQTLQAAGFDLLSGRWIDIQVDGKTVRLAGDDRPWGAGLAASAPPVSSDSVNGDAIPCLILSHSPDNIFRLRRFPGARAVFSGHVHGGQLRMPLPVLGANSPAGSTAVILPSAFGRLLDRGHFVVKSPAGQPVHLFVCAGLGAAEPPLRLYCPPEVLVVKFIGEQTQ